MKKIFLNLIILFSFLNLIAETPNSLNNEIAYDNRSDSLDIIHTIVHVNFGNYMDRKINAYTILQCKSKLNGLSNINIDLRGLTVDSIRTNGILTSFDTSSQSIHVNFPTTFNLNDSFNLEFYYHGTPFLDITDFGGFYWSNTYAYNVGVSFNEMQHSYGRTWFPCLDNFVERCTYEYFITTDSTRKAFCGGNLVQTILNFDGSKTWHWINSQNIPSYLASVAVAKYATIADTFIGIERTIPIEIGVLANDSNKLKSSFTNLDQALRIFESDFGPYKFDRVGYSITDYNGGAMEHACNITYPAFAINGTLTYEKLMAHELSHHWWGDLVTCENASEMWLNEGWAVYCEHLFTEGLYGRQDYQDLVRSNHADVLQFAHIKDSGYYALNNVPLKFSYGRTSYDKGADIAHTLRSYLGDTMFFRVLKDYMNYYAFKSVKSENLRDFINSNSSYNISNFFTDWVFSPGFAQFSIDYSSYSPGNLKLWINQKLNHTDHYYNNVPIEITVFDQNFNKSTFQIFASGRCTNVEIPTTFNPSYIALDFNEKLSDAIIDEYITIKNTGVKNLTTAKLNIDCKRVGADSILFRVEHNYVAPSPMKYKIEGLHLHNYRYWNIDGLFNDDSTKINATFNYNGTNSLTNGFLDNSFLSNSEDSIVLMYRKNGVEDWRFCDSFKLFTNGSPNDKTGKIVAYNIKKGQYCFAIYDSRYEDTVLYEKDCNLLSLPIQNTANQLYVYPNPTDNLLAIKISKLLTNAYLNIYDIQGTLIKSSNNINTSDYVIDTKTMHNGIYLIKYFNKEEEFTTKFEVIK